MLSLKEFISIDEAWSKTIAKNTKDFNVHINTEINQDSNYYLFYLYGKTWYYRPKAGIRVVKGSDLIKTIKLSNSNLFPTIQPLDIYINPAGIGNEKLDGTILAPLTVNHIVWKYYFFVEINRLSANPSDEDYSQILNLLEPGEYSNVNSLVQKALVWIKDRQGVFNAYSKGATDTGWDIQNTITENTDPIEYLEGDEVMRRLFALIMENIEGRDRRIWSGQKGAYAYKSTIDYVKGKGVNIPNADWWPKNVTFKKAVEEQHKIRLIILESLINLPRDIQHELLGELSKRTYHNLVILYKNRPGFLGNVKNTLIDFLLHQQNYKLFSDLAAELKEIISVKRAYKSPDLDWDLGNTI